MLSARENIFFGTTIFIVCKLNFIKYYSCNNKRVCVRRFFWKESGLKKFIKKILNKIKDSRLFLHTVSTLLYWYVLLVGKTTKWTIDGTNKFYDVLKKDKSLIVVAWHGRILMLPYFWNRSGILKALVSLHRDGRLVVRLLESFGIGTIGGSTNQNATAAAVSLMKTLKKNDSIAIIPDGPRGPSMTMTLSPLYYAQKTGKPIVGITFSIKGAKIARSWDSMMIAPLFSTGVVSATDPFYIPRDATKDDLEKYRFEIEQKLNEITHKADEKMGIPFVTPGKEAKRKKHAKQ